MRLAPDLANDLASWWQECGRPADDSLVFSGQDGRPWSRTAWQSWRRRVYAASAAELGLPTSRPYDLRHSFVSLLIREGRSVVEVAQEAGHAPTMALCTYAHVFAEIDHERIPAEEQIARARASVYPFCTQQKSRAEAALRNPCKR